MGIIISRRGWTHDIRWVGQWNPAPVVQTVVYHSLSEFIPRFLGLKNMFQPWKKVVQDYFAIIHSMATTSRKTKITIEMLKSLASSIQHDHYPWEMERIEPCGPLQAFLPVRYEIKIGSMLRSVNQRCCEKKLKKNVFSKKTWQIMKHPSNFRNSFCMDVYGPIFSLDVHVYGDVEYRIVRSIVIMVDLRCLSVLATLPMFAEWSQLQSPARAPFLRNHLDLLKCFPDWLLFDLTWVYWVYWFWFHPEFCKFLPSHTWT